MLLCGQIDGTIVIINYAMQVVNLQIQVIGSGPKDSAAVQGPNCMYYMAPFTADFNIENNPIIVVND